MSYFPFQNLQIQNCKKGSRSLHTSQSFWTRISCSCTTVSSRRGWCREVRITLCTRESDTSLWHTFCFKVLRCRGENKWLQRALRWEQSHCKQDIVGVTVMYTLSCLIIVTGNVSMWHSAYFKPECSSWSVNAAVNLNSDTSVQSAQQSLKITSLLRVPSPLKAACEGYRAI